MKWTFYETRFPPAECIRRITSATEPDSFLRNLRPTKGVLARIGEDRFRLRLRHAYFGNSFSRVLYARLKTTSRGSVLQVRTGLELLVLVDSILWFAGAVLVGGVIMVAGVLQLLGMTGRAEANPWLAVLMPPALLAFGVLLVRTGRSDATELRRFMEEVLEARAHTAAA